MIKRHQLDARYALISTLHYPCFCARRLSLKVKAGSRSSGRHSVLVGVGGNIGNVLRRFEHLYWFLKRSRQVRVLESAPILRNPPFGFEDQPDFYNTMLLLETSLTPRALLSYLLRVERKFGRKRTIKDGPRTLDLDIIFYDDLQIDSAVLTIPHPEWMKRDSVLIPMKYMKGRR